MVAVVVVVVVGGLVFAGEVLGQARQPGLVDGPKSVVRRRSAMSRWNVTEDCPGPASTGSVRGRTTAWLSSQSCSQCFRSASRQQSDSLYMVLVLRLLRLAPCTGLLAPKTQVAHQAARGPRAPRTVTACVRAQSLKTSPSRRRVQQVIVGVCIPTGGKARGVGQAEEDSLAKMPGDKSGFMLLAATMVGLAGWRRALPLGLFCSRVHARRQHTTVRDIVSGIPGRSAH
jgi:hypothetical protein